MAMLAARYNGVKLVLPADCFHSRSWGSDGSITFRLAGGGMIALDAGELLHHAQKLMLCLDHSTRCFSNFMHVT
jgi:hypothetical protein